MSVIRAIIVDAARSFHVAPREIVGPGRTMRVCAARYAVMHKLNERGWSSVRIGQVLNRHHTTVLHGLGRLGR